MRIILREEGHEYKSRSKMPVRTPEEAENAVKELKYLEQEAFAVLSLSSKNNLISSDIITLGIIDTCLAHPREVFRTAIKQNAASIILAHNHPSGDTTPSIADIQLTKKLIEAGNIIDIKVLDHIILGDKTFSMREEGIVRF